MLSTTTGPFSLIKAACLDAEQLLGNSRAHIAQAVAGALVMLLQQDAAERAGEGSPCISLRDLEEASNEAIRAVCDRLGIEEPEFEPLSETAVTCPSCNGRHLAPSEQCHRCMGRGEVSNKRAGS